MQTIVRFPPRQTAVGPFSRLSGVNERGAPPFVFSKGGIPRSSPTRDLSLTPEVPSSIGCAGDSHHPPVLQSTRKGSGALAAGANLRIVPGELQLIASKQQLFKRHPPHLPKFALLLVRVQLALALVIKGQSHLKHRIAFIVAH